MRRLCLVLLLAIAACAAPSATHEATTTTVAPSTTAPLTTTQQTATQQTPTTTPMASGSCGHSGAAPHRYDHVIWIWMENKNSTAIKPSSAPFLASLAATCGMAADYRDNGVHPSLPNYILATSGSTQNIHDDSGPAAHPLTADNIFRQVRATGGSAASYIEDMPRPCALQAAGRYAVKHNPAAYYQGADDRAACLRDDVSFTQFQAASLPTFALIVPNLCDDTHDCAVPSGDTWLKDVVTSITSSATYAQGRTVILVAWDESSGTGAMPFFVIAPTVRAGTIATEQLGHTDLLTFTEDALGITTHLANTRPGAMASAFDL